MGGPNQGVNISVVKDSLKGIQTAVSVKGRVHSWLRYRKSSYFLHFLSFSLASYHVSNFLFSVQQNFSMSVWVLEMVCNFA